MTAGPELRRNSPAMLLIRASESVAVVVPTLLAWLSMRTRWPTWFGVPLDVIVTVGAGLALLALVVDWWFTRYAVDDTGVSLRTGLALRRSVFVAWPEVVSVQVSRSAACRALGCSRVTVGVGAQSQSALVLEAVPAALAARLEGDFARSREPGTTPASVSTLPLDDPSPTTTVSATSASPFSTPPTSSPPEGELVYRIRPRDYLMLSVTYGQFALVVPFALSLYSNLLDVLELRDTAFDLPTLDLPLPVPVLVMLALATALPLAVGFGMTVAWLRFRRFEVRRRGGVFAMTGGLLSAESRQAGRAQVAGLRIQQNPVMRATGFARVRFVSRQSGERIGANILFPAVRLATVRRELAGQFPEHAAALARCDRPRPALAWALLVPTVAVLTGTVWALWGQPAVRATVVVVAVGLALLVATNHCWASASFDRATGVLSFRRGFVWVTHYVVPCSSLYFAESYAVSLPGGRRVAATCLGLYDARAVRLWVPLDGSDLLTEFADRSVRSGVAAS